MPRIAASLGVVVVVAACIGFNTMRYPIVWEMAAGSHQLSQVAQTVNSAEMEPRGKAAEDGQSHTAQTPSRPTYICTGDICRIATPEDLQKTPATATAAKPAVSHEPPARPPVANARTIAKEDEPDVSTAPVEGASSIGMLVPVTRRPDVPSERSETAQATRIRVAPVSQQLATAAGVRPLPPLDSAEAEVPPPVSMGGAQVPIYPSTNTKASWR